MATVLQTSADPLANVSSALSRAADSARAGREVELDFDALARQVEMVQAEVVQRRRADILRGLAVRAGQLGRQAGTLIRSPAMNNDVALETAMGLAGLSSALMKLERDEREAEL